MAKVFLIIFSIFSATLVYAGNSCADFFSESVSSKALREAKKIDPDNISSEPISVSEFDSLVKGLTSEKLLWFSLQEFAQEQIDIWKPREKVKNFISYTVEIYVKKSEEEIVVVTLPLVSFLDTRSGGFSWHIHLWRHFKENYLSDDQVSFVDKGAVIIEKSGRNFLVEDNNAYPHKEDLEEGRMLVPADKSKSVLFKKRK